MATTEERIISLISEHLGVDASQIRSNSNFIDDLGADSLDHVDLILAIEHEFGISIPDEEAEKLETLAQVAAFVDNCKH